MRAPTHTAAFIALLIVSTSACGPPNPAATATHSSETASPTPSASPGSAGAVVLGALSRGTTVQVARGETVVVRLDNTYWTIDGGSDLAVLAPQGDQSTSPSADCLPGVGCGTVERRFRAVGPGVSTITASRTVCGEAMACQPQDATFGVRLNVG
jgi:hypothetical protein